jgi:gliding motility-associated-like protein
LVQLPVLDVFNSGMNPTCFGLSNGQVAAIASAGTPPYTYLWNYSIANSYLLNNVPAGLYAVTVTDAYNCTDTASLVLTQPDSLSGLPTQKNIDCKGNKTGSANIIIGGGTPPYAYQWVLNSSLTNEILNVKAGTYTVNVKDANNCTYTHVFTLTEPPLLTATTTITEIICHNSATGTATVNIQGGTPAYTVSWTSTPSQDSTTAINLAAGVYYAYIVDSQLCTTRARATFTNPPYLRVSLMDTMPVYCNRTNGEVTVYASGGIPPYTFTWDTDPEQTGVIATNLGEGTYSVMLTDARGCQDSLTQSLTNVPPAVPLFTSNPTFTSPILLSQAELISFQNLTTGAVAYSWDFGDAQVSDLKNPKHGFFKTQTYTVTLTAYDPYYSCPTTFSADYEIIFDGALFLPNAFTPNGDGINDFFGAYGDGLIRVDMSVFDRWGNEIFHTNTIGDDWDGTIKGQSAPEGTYTYRIEAAFNDGKIFKRGGTVSILR